MTLLFRALLPVALAAPLALGQEWTRFRGPGGTGVSPAAMSFAGISANNLVWKSELPGPGHSSPVGWGDLVFLTSAGSQRYSVLGVDAGSGSIVWTTSFPMEEFHIHRFNSLASSTPAVDAERVYATWGDGDRVRIAAFDHQGDLIWKRDLGVYRSLHGPGTSPMLFEDLVVMANEHLGEGFIVALDRATGEIRWKTPRGKADKTAYSTPAVVEGPQGEPVLLANSQANGMGALDPRTGRLLWQYPGAFDKRSCSSPVMAAGLVFGTCGSGGGGNYLVALRPPDGKERAQPELAYQIRRAAPYVPTPLHFKGRLFLWSDGGILSCVDPATGEVAWSERLPGYGAYFGSPVGVGEEIVAVSDSGDLHVVEGSGAYRILGSYGLGETCHATPAFMGGHMYVRTVSHLWKFRPVR